MRLSDFDDRRELRRDELENPRDMFRKDELVDRQPFLDDWDSMLDGSRGTGRHRDVVVYSVIQRTRATKTRGSVSSLLREAEITYNPWLISKIVQSFHRIDARHSAILHSEKNIRPVDVNISDVLSNENEIRSKGTKRERERGTDRVANEKTKSVQLTERREFHVARR